MEKVIKLYTYVDGVNDTPFPSKEEQVEIFAFEYNAERMGSSPSINAKAKHRLCLDELWSDKVYAIFNNERFFVKNTPSSSKSNNDERYEHELQLLSERDILNHVYFIDAVQGNPDIDRPISNSTKIQFMGDIEEFVSRLNSSLSYSGLEYTAEVDRGITSDKKLVSFQDKYILQSLQEAFTNFEIPYYFKGKVIHFGFTDNAVTYPLEYGRNGALLSINKNNANNAIINRITGTGSSDNIPPYYPNPSGNRQEVENAGGTWIIPSQTLMPPIYRESKGKERFYNAVSGIYDDKEGGTYKFENEYSKENQLEGVTEFSEIKPSIVGITNSLGYRIDKFLEFAYDEKDDDSYDEKTNEYNHPYFFAKLRKTDGAYGFNLFDQANEKQEMVVSMTSGVCGACNFTIGVGEETQKNIVQVDGRGNLLRDKDGNVKRSGEPQDVQNDTRNNEVWIALKKDINTYPTFVPMPNVKANLRPSVNDTFVLIGITMPQAYVDAAEKKLEDSLIRYMWLNNKEKFSFSIAFSRIFFSEHPELLEQINENARVIVSYNGTEHTLYIDSYSYKMDGNNPLPEIGVNLVDTLSSSKNSLQTTLDKVKQDILSGMGGGDFLKQGLKYFLRKDVNDIAKGVITFLKGIKIGEYVPNTSGGIFGVEDKTKHTFIEVDKLDVRMKATFKELEMSKVSTIGGEELITPAGSIKISKVEEVKDELENVLSYKCYFVADLDGEKIENLFQVGDLALSQTFNAKDIAENKISNRRYWREVVERGDDFIVLSKVSCEEGSDIPMAGDTICQLGSNKDKTRQNAIILSSVNAFSPSVILYQGIDTFSLVGKEVISYGFDSIEGKPYMNVYGTFYYGDKGENPKYFIKYNPKEGLELQGKISIKSTIGDDKKTLGERNKYVTYLQEKALQEDTTVEGGLIQASQLSLGYTNESGKREINAGTNGVYDKNKIGGGIAAWYGGNMIDLFDYYDEETETFKGVPANAAKGVDRMDGTGYRANGNLWWDKTGKLYADPLSFFVGEDTVGALLKAFRFHPTAINPIYVEPIYPFNHLKTNDYITIGDCKLAWDKENNALSVIRVNGDVANFYATGEVSAYGKGEGGSGGYELPIASEYTLGGIKVGSGLSISSDGVLSANAQSNFDSKEMWRLLSLGTNEQIDSSHLSDSLNGYATKSWVGLQGYALSSSIPTNNNQLVNGAGYITSSALTNYALISQIPTNNSQLDNGAGYITSSSLTPYAKKTDIPTRLSQLFDDETHRLVTDNEKRRWNKWDNNFEIVTINGKEYIKALKDFFSVGEVSAYGKGDGSSGGGGGIDPYTFWQMLGTNSTDQQISKDHLTDALDGYLTSVPQAGYYSLGGVKINYSSNGKNYALKLDSEGNAYVNVPWEKTDISGKANTDGSNVNGTWAKLSIGGNAATATNAAYADYINDEGVIYKWKISYAGNELESARWLCAFVDGTNSDGSRNDRIEPIDPIKLSVGWTNNIKDSNGVSFDLKYTGTGDGEMSAKYLVCFTDSGYSLAPIEPSKLSVNNSSNLGGKPYSSYVTTDTDQSITGIKTYDNGFYGKSINFERDEWDGTQNVDYLGCIDRRKNKTLYIQFNSQGNLSLCSGGGNVGIGVNEPQYKLHVSGDIKTDGMIVGNITDKQNIGSKEVCFRNVYTHWVASGSSLPLILGASNGEAIYIDTSQNVGIGTNNPSEKLEVNGNIIANAYKINKNNSVEYSISNVLNPYNASFRDGNQHIVEQNSFQSMLAWSNVISNQVGYITRYSIGSHRTTSGWGEMVLSVGDDDYGTSRGITLTLGGNGNATLEGNFLATGEVTAYSDARLKDNVKPLENRGFIEPKTYVKDGKESIGFLAQDVQKLYPELVKEDNSKEKYLSLNYSQMTAVLESQIIEQKKEIDELRKMIVELKGIIKDGNFK